MAQPMFTKPSGTAGTCGGEIHGNEWLASHGKCQNNDMVFCFAIWRISNDMGNFAMESLESIDEAMGMMGDVGSHKAGLCCAVIPCP